MKHLIKILKGIAIGIANIIPGFSGGTMAVIVKSYEEMVNALANLTKHPLIVMKESWSLFVGILSGFLIGFIGIVKLLEVAPLITILFFFGLLLGSLPKRTAESLEKPFNPYTLIPFFIAFALIIVLPILAGNVTKEVESISWTTYLIVFILGIFSAAAMILPGLSGSMILLIFGYYHYVLGSAKDLFKGILSFQFDGLLEPFLITLIISLGIVVGILGMSKIIKKLYSTYPRYCNMAILGLLMASLFAIIYSSNISYNGSLFQAEAWEWVVGVICALLGAGLVIFLDYYKFKEKEVLEDELENSDI